MLLENVQKLAQIRAVIYKFTYKREPVCDGIEKRLPRLKRAYAGKRFRHCYDLIGERNRFVPDFLALFHNVLREIESFLIFSFSVQFIYLFEIGGRFFRERNNDF